MLWIYAESGGGEFGRRDQSIFIMAPLLARH